MHDVTDIHIIAEDNFYYTIEYYFPKTSLFRKLEEISFLKLGAIGLCKSGVAASCKQISGNELAAPQGLISRKIFDQEKQINRHFLWVSEGLSNQVVMYEVEFDYRLVSTLVD